MGALRIDPGVSRGSLHGNKIYFGLHRIGRTTNEKRSGLSHGPTNLKVRHLIESPQLVSLKLFIDLFSRFFPLEAMKLIGF